MPVEISIDDADLAGFSAPAKLGLKAVGEEFVRHVIAEANRLESAQNAGGGPVEITNGMVANAALIQRHSVGGKKIATGTKVLRIVAAALALLVGVMVDKERMQETMYFAAFVFVIAAAILTTTISIMKE